MPILNKHIIYQVVLTTLLLSRVVTGSAQTPEVKDYQIKAAFLFNFTQFVEWPSGAYAAGEPHFVIGILGEDPFKSFLDELVAGERVQGRKIVIRRFAQVEEVKNCQILFIHDLKKDKLKHALSGIKGKRMLTVSDEATFLETGGMIRFVTLNQKIQLQINPDAAKAANLNISAKLLRLAEIVVPD